MSNTTIALTFVMIVNALMFLTQVAIVDIGPTNPNTLYNYNGTILQSFGGENQDLDSQSLSNYLPGSTDSQLDTSSGSVFTDIFRSMKKFLISLPGVNYLYMTVTAPYTLLKGIFIGHPEMAFALGTFWWGLTVFLIVQFIWGRE